MEATIPEEKIEDIKKEEDALKQEIEQPSRLEKQAKIVVFSIGIILIVILALLFIRKSNAPPGTIDYYKYGNFEIQKIKDLSGLKGAIYKIKINVNNKDFYVYPRYEPKDTENISIEKDTKQKVIRQGKEIVYLHVDKTQKNLSVDIGLAGLEIKNFLDNPYLYNIPVRFENNSKNCSDADEKTSVIFLKLGDETKIYQDKECVIVQGTTEEEIIRAADRLLFYILGIMPREIK